MMTTQPTVEPLHAGEMRLCHLSRVWCNPRSVMGDHHHSQGQNTQTLWVCPRRRHTPTSITFFSFELPWRGVHPISKLSPIRDSWLLIPVFWCSPQIPASGLPKFETFQPHPTGHQLSARCSCLRVLAAWCGGGGASWQLGTHPFGMVYRLRCTDEW